MLPKIWLKIYFSSENEIVQAYGKAIVWCDFWAKNKSNLQ